MKKIVFFLILLYSAEAQAAGEQDLAKKLANPVSSLISVPLQGNVDCCFGPKQGYRYTLNLQPVVPVPLDDDWNLIVRTILPMVYRQAPAAGFDDRFGLGDTEQSFFLSPAKSRDGVVWGVGPVFLWPTATDRAFGTGKWGAGPTAVALRQAGGWTYGALANHVWSYAGHGDRESVSQSFVQPFLSYTFPSTFGLSLSSETSYDWGRRAWTVPINAGVSRLLKIGGRPVSVGLSGRYYARAPHDGPKWGLRFVTTLLFPEK